VERKKQKFICNVKRKYVIKVQNFVSVNMKFTFKRYILKKKQSEKHPIVFILKIMVVYRHFFL
jgi:hypothetical protein